MELTKNPNDKAQLRAAASNFASNIEVNHPTNDGDEKFYWIASNPANPDHLYASLNNWNWQHRIFRNTDIDNADSETVKANWEDVPHPRRAPLGSDDPDREPGAVGVAFDPEDADILYIAYSSSSFLDGDAAIEAEYAKQLVYRMDLGNLTQFPSNAKFKDCMGVPCQDLTMNLPNSFMRENSLAYEQGSNGGLYVALESGVYFTNTERIGAYDPSTPVPADNMDNTSGWVRIGNNLPHVQASGLEINYQVNKIRVGLTGRGVWEHDLFCPVAENYSTDAPHPVQEFVEVRSNITSSGLVAVGSVVNYRAGNSVSLTPGFRAVEGARFHAFIHPCDSEGNSLSPKFRPSSETWSEHAEEDEVDGGLLIYPNPSTHSFTVVVPLYDAKTPATINLYDATGKLINTGAMSGATHQFDLDLQDGLYTVRVVTSGAEYVGRMMLIPYK